MSKDFTAFRSLHTFPTSTNVFFYASCKTVMDSVGEMLLAFLWKNAPKGLWGILNKRFHPARNPSGFPKIGAGRLIPVSMNVVWHMPLTRQG